MHAVSAVDPSDLPGPDPLEPENFQVIFQISRQNFLLETQNFQGFGSGYIWLGQLMALTNP